NIGIAILKILNNFLNIKEIDQQIVEKILAKVLSQISSSDDQIVDIVLNLSKKLEIVNHTNLLKFLYQILIENENKIMRNEAYEILSTCEFYSDNLKYINETVELEKKCLTKIIDTEENIFEDCLEQVKMKNKLTLNCFHMLTEL
ncbi:unnamed protein product, partial [Didymodactylos carnosus]